MAFLSCEAALKCACSTRQQLRQPFATENCLGRRARLQNPGRKVEQRQRKILSAFTRASNSHKFLRNMKCYFSDCLLTQETPTACRQPQQKHQVFSWVKMPFSLTSDSFVGKLRHKAEFTLSQEKQLFSGCWSDSFQHNTEDFHWKTGI